MRECDRPDKELLTLLQGGLPLMKEPYKALDELLGRPSGEEVRERIARLKQGADLSLPEDFPLCERPFAALYHRRAGLFYHSLISWNARGEARRLARGAAKVHLPDKLYEPSHGE